MNIFYFDSDPFITAKQHCDKHVVKMIVEYAQLLSTAHRVLDGKETIIKTEKGRRKKIWILEDEDFNDALYAATHVNHPSAKWVRDSYNNYEWLLNLLVFLSAEYTRRYGKIHKTSQEVLPYLVPAPQNIDINKPFSPPWRAMPDQYKIDKSVDTYCELSYQAYFNGEKQKLAKWKHNEIPSWFIQK